MSPIEELQSLNHVSKLRETARIDNENMRIMDRLAKPNLRIPNTYELEEDYEQKLKLREMISRSNKHHAKH